MKKILKLSLLFILVLVTACGSDDDASCLEKTWYQDADADGFGNPAVTLNSCTQPVGYVLGTLGGDLDDNNASVYPNATEICDGIDNDGDGLVDGDNTNCGAGEVCENGSCVTAITYYADIDADGYGDANDSVIAGSTAPVGYVVDGTDCDDTDPSINPGATEIPDNNIDEDCDASLSKDYTFYADVDGDGYGDISNPLVASCPAPCNNEAELTIPTGYVFNNIDCNDSDSNIHPFANENTTDGIDNNCNGNTDIVYYYQDADGDGFGDENDSGTTVNFAGSSTNNTDCDDNDSAIYFGALEIMDGLDNNCNGLVDEF